MKAGSRVLYKSSTLYQLGIVTVIKGDKATVLLDQGKILPIDTSKLIQILYFEKFIPGNLDKAWFSEHQKLIKPVDYDIRTFFLLKKTFTNTECLMTCMFYWLNQYVFESKLTKPKLSTNTRQKGLSGVWRPGENLLSVSKKINFSLNEIWSTMCHETVHVYQTQVNHMQEGSWDPASGGHGKSFWRWKGPLQEIAGVTLNKIKDIDSITVDEIEESSSKAPSVYILAVIVELPLKTYYLVCKNDKEENIADAKKAIRAKYNMQGTYKTRLLNNAPLLSAITNCKSKTGSTVANINGYYFSQVNESVFNSILKAAKPLE